MSDSSPWSPHPKLPSNPEFYRRVLDHMPTPLVVVDTEARVVYANQALIVLSGRDLDKTVGTDAFIYVHPEDHEWIANSFLEIVDDPSSRLLGSRQPWAEIYCRMVTRDGRTVPLEVIGTGGILDDVVGGVIYEVRVARHQDIYGRLLDGLAQGASLHQLFALVTEIVANPPLDLEAAVLKSVGDGTFVVAASTSTFLTEGLTGLDKNVPWSDSTSEPARVPMGELPPDLADRLVGAGQKDFWSVGVESTFASTTLRIVACAPTHHVPDRGPINRLVRARELASVVLLRSGSPRDDAFAAEHDPLTVLTNRPTFRERLSTADPTQDRAIVHLDLDGFRRVNAAHGHAAGDAVLQIIADRIRSVCHSNDLITRWGDDEFLILAAESPDRNIVERARVVAEEVFNTVLTPIIVAGRSIKVTASVGVAVAPTGELGDRSLVAAEEAMRAAKHSGGATIHFAVTD